MEDFEQLMAEAVSAATRGDLQALLMAQTMLAHLRCQLEGVEQAGVHTR